VRECESLLARAMKEVDHKCPDSMPKHQWWRTSGEAARKRATSSRRKWVRRAQARVRSAALMDRAGLSGTPTRTRLLASSVFLKPALPEGQGMNSEHRKKGPTHSE
jgi:hypothetical protein